MNCHICLVSYHPNQPVKTTLPPRLLYLLLTLFVGLAAGLADCDASCVPTAAGLVSWWPAEGNATDRAGLNHGTLAGATFVAGKVGQAFNCNGGQKIIIPDNDSLKLTNSLTIEGWIFANGAGFIAFRGDSRPGLDPYVLSVELTGELQLVISADSGAVAVLRTPAALPTGQWKHVAASLDGASGDMKLYVDGDLAAQTNTPLRPLRDLDPAYDPGLGIGGHAGGYGYFPFNGAIDELSLYNRALSAAEIQASYNAGSAGKCAPATPPACVSAPPDVVGWWQGESNAMDIAGANHGTLLNGAGFAAGEVGGAFLFDGVNDYVRIPPRPGLNAASQLTVEFWMKADSGNAMNTYQGLVTSDFYGIEIANGFYPGPLGVEFFISTDGGASVSPSSYPDTATVNGGGAVVSANVWHHVAGTYDGTKLQLYIDGQPWGVPNYHTGAISPMRDNSFVAIGSEDGRTGCPDCVSSRYFNGQIDEAAIYRRALSASEIQAIYAAGSAGKCVPATSTCVTPPSGVVGWWPAEGNPNDAVSGNHGTLQGGVTFAPGKVGQGFRLDGTNSYVQIADSAALKPANVTVESWVWLDSNITTPRVEYLIFKKNSWDFLFEGYSLLKESRPNGDGTYTDRFSFVVSSGGNQVITYSTTAVQRGVWYHVAGTYDGNQLTLWVNGAAEASAIAGFALDYGTRPVFIGTSGQPEPYNGKLAGILDEPSIYNRALSTNEITALYVAGSAGKCVPVATTNNCIVPPSGLVGWWQAEGNAVDAISGTSGTLQGGTTFVAGQAGQTFKFNGTDSYVQVPDAPALRLTNELTIECWVKRQQLTDDYLVNKGGDWTGGALNYGLGIAGPGNGNVLHFLYAGGIRGTVSITDFNWHHCAVTARNGDADAVFYVDGVQQPIGQRTGPPTIDLYPSTAPLLIGAQIAPIASYFSAAQIDELGLYNRILSASEIQSIYNAGSAGKCAPETQTNHCVPPPSGLVSWWRGENNPNDGTGGNQGILRNSPSFGGGEAGSAFSFSGANDCVEIPYSASLVPPTFTVETWVRPAAQVSDDIGQDLIFGQGFGHCQLVARTGTTGVRIAWQFGTNPSNFPEVQGAGEIPIGEFTHLAGTWDGTTLKLYINGVLNAQSAPGASPADSGCPFYIGGFYTPGESSCSYVGQFFNGLIDEVSLYNRALADAEIQSLYSAGGAGKCVPVTSNCVSPSPGLVGWWPGDGNDNAVAGGDNATLQGGATFAPGKVGQGFRFDGANGYAQIPDSDALKPAHVTCEAWVWLDPSLPAGRGGEQIVFKKNTWSAWFEGYGLSKGTIDSGDGTSSDRFQFVVSRYGNQVVINSQTIAQRGVWYHVAATYDGSQSKLYVNGALEATATPGFELDYDTTPIFIGTSGTWPPYLSMFGGVIDEPSIYNRALSANELAAIYNAGSAGKCAGTSSNLVSVLQGPITNAANGSVYYLLSPASWTRSEAKAIELGGHLATINDSAENEWVHSTFSGDGTRALWIGLNDFAAEGSFMWASAELSSYSNWYPGEPNDYGDEDYAYLGFPTFADSTWNDQPDNAINPASGADFHLSTYGVVEVPAQPHRCVPPPSGLVAWWPAEGNAQDALRANNGVLANGLGFAPGKVGTAFSFDGADDHFDIPASPGLDVGAASGMTFETWVKPSSIAMQAVAEWNNGVGGVGAHLWLSVDHTVAGDGVGNIYANLYDTTETVHYLLSPANVMLADEWQHLAVTYDKTSGVGTLYRNGVVVASQNLGVFTPQTSYDLHLGYRASSAFFGTYFGGLMDEPALYNRALSPGEIQSIYTAGTSGKCVSGSTNSPQVLLNVDFGAGAGPTTKTGPAAVGHTGDDFWNFFTRDDGAGGWRTFGALTDLKLADGTVTTIGLSIANAPGAWGNGSTDPMLDGFIYPFDGGNVTVTLSNLPAGQYDVLPYSLNGNYEVTSGGVSYGIKSCYGFPVANPPVWTDGVQFTRFSNVQVAAGQALVIIARPTESDVALISGLQIAGSTATNTVLQTNCTPAPSGLVAWWPGNGTTDELIHGHNATLADGASYANGVVGQGFNLDGVAGRVLVPDAPELNFGSHQNLSIECWIKAFPNSNPSNVRSIVEKRNAAENYRGYTLFLWDGFLAFQLSEISVGVNYFSGGADLRDDVFHHVAVTVDRDSPTGGRLFVDGQVIYTFDPTGVAGDLSNSGLLRIGSHAAPGDPSFFPGVIDEVAIYNRELSPAEIQAIYEAGGGGKCAVDNGCANFANFNSTNALNLVGSATVTNGALRLTAATAGQSGAAWLTAKQPCVLGFDTTFHFSITEPGNISDGEPGGEGFTFAVQNLDPADNSGAMGGANQFVGVFFNTFYNPPADEGDDTIGIVVNQTYVAQANLNYREIYPADGGVHAAHIVYNGTGISVWLDGALVLNNVPVPGLQPGVDESGQAWVGFTAGTSAAYENHDILDWTFCSTTNPPPPVCAPASPGVIGWWPAENTAQDLVTGNYGTLLNGANFSAGKIGQAFNFNGVNQNVQIPMSPLLNAGNELTIEFWMNADPANAMNNYQRLVSCGNYGIEIANGQVPGPLGVSFFLTTDNGASSFPDTATVNGGGAIVSAGVWHHVAGTYDGTKLQLYIDGQPWGVPNNHTGVITPTPPGTSLFIGGEENQYIGQRYFNGRLDEPTVYQRALSAAEILALYNAGSAGKCALSQPLYTNTVFYVDVNTTSAALPYDSWSNAAATIQDALDIAPPGAQIFVNDGVYQTGSASADGGSANRVAVNKAVTIQSAHGADSTLIDGGGALRCVSLNSGATLIGFTLTNGVTSGNGGGVVCASTTARLINCTLTRNSAAGSGGGAFSGSLSNCAVIGNTAFNGAGADSSVLDFCTVNGNSKSAIFFCAGGGLNNCTASDCTINGNNSWYGAGANASTLTRCTLNDNYAGGSGGGANNSTLSRCTLSGNTSGPGGGLNGCTADNCLLTGNLANWGGAASGSTLNNCTLADNRSLFDGGGVVSSTLNNCILYFNAILYSPGSTSYNYSPDCALNYSCTLPLPAAGAGNLDNPPLFANRSAGNYRLQSGSFCINTGTNALATNATDLDGNPRIFQGTVDLGAYEFQSPVDPLVFIQPDYTLTLTGVPLNFAGSVFRGSFSESFWDFGDGSVVSNQLAVSHAWTAAGNFQVTLTAITASGMVSATALVHVDTAQIQPAVQNVAVGNNTSFSITSPNFTQVAWQWRFNGTNLPGATASTLTLLNLQLDQAGEYSAEVTLNSPPSAPPGPHTLIASSAQLIVHPPVCTTPPPNLISWWRAESNALDHVSGNDGTLMNGTGFAPGNVGQAFSFDGVSNYVEIASSPLLNFGGNLTVEAWVKYDRLTGANGGTIVMKGADAEVPADWALTISPEHKLRPHVQLDDGWHYFDCNTTLQTGVWYHVVMVYNGTFLAGYVNGNLDGATVAVTPYPYRGVHASDNPIKIGAYASGVAPADTSFFSGQIDEVSIYNRAVGMYSDTEIPSLYNAGGAGKCDVPIAPTLVANPADARVLPGTNALFRVTVAGSRPLSYQWLVNNEPIPGETNATLNLPDIQYSQSGNYYSAIITNAGGSVTSGSALLEVINTPPQLSSIGSQIVSYIAPPLPLAFIVSDAESPVGSLQITVSSSNTNLVPNEYLLLDGTGTNRTLTPRAITNVLGSTTITVSVLDPGGLSAQRSFVLTVINNQPQVSPIAYLITPPNVTSAPIAFTISDNETPADQLLVSVRSTDPAVVPTNAIVLAGSGSERTVTLTPAQPGITTLILTVTDGLGGTGGTSFQVTVTNLPPQISSIAAQRAPLGTTLGPLAFTVSDDQTPAGQIMVTASSSNTGIVPTNQILLGGTGTNRTVTILPGTNAPGVATVTLTATDNLGAAGSRSFSVTLDQFTSLAPGLPALTFGAVAWGDYDNDGQLDLLVSGTTNGLASGAATRIYHNNGGVFTNTPFINLPGVYRSAVAWNDYDRDGFLDFVVSGLTSSNQPVARLYHNNGNGTFTDAGAGLTGAYSGTLAWGDFDNDGAADLFLSGLTIISSNGVTAITTNLARLYRNTGSGGFLDMNLNLLTTDNRIAAPSLGTAAWGDYDNDGRPDLLLVGALNNLTGMANVYRNLGGGNFTNIFSTQIVSYYGGAGAWGDYDNDGWLDLSISGALSSTALYHNNRNGTFSQIVSLSGNTTPTVAWGDYNNDGYLDLLVGGSTSILYRNNGNGTFTSSGITLPSILNGAVAWGDADGDGDLDLLFAGSATTLHRNNSGVANTPPAVPANLAFVLGLTNSVVFTWSRPLDTQTGSNGLNFNLRMGTNENVVNIVAPMADPVTGLRRVAALGNVSPTNRALLLNLPQGTYYWSVQTIDTAFAGSPFALHDKFIITNALPVISDIPDTTIAPGTNSPGPVIPFTIGDFETSAGSLVLTARSSNTNIVALTNIVFGGSGSNRTVQVAARTNGIAVITVIVTDAQGAFASDNFTLRAEQFSLQSSNFIQVQNSLVAWGDFNNDGRLDVLMSGNTNGSSAGPPVTKLYRNDGNGIFTPVAAGFPGVTFGSAAWCDFNNDGWLDLILTGTTNSFVSRGIANLYRNNQDGTFTEINAGLTGVLNSSVAWGDYDNDGRADLLIIGSTNFSASGGMSRIYHNNGNGAFSNAVTLPAFSSGAAAWGDFDGDGDLDLVLAGQNSGGTAVTQVYRNNGDGSFTLAATLTGVYSGSVAVGDFDNDGRPDILLAGQGANYFTAVYRNTGNFIFSNIGVSLPVARPASVGWGDFDNDGRLDFFISGFSPGAQQITPPLSQGGFARVYRNTGSTVLSQSFTNYPVNLPTNYAGALTWADFDNDGRLDILLTGTDGAIVGSATRSQTALFRNNNNVTNTPPGAPAALTFVRSNNLVALAWAKATDAQTTNANGLKYQIRVGTNSGGIQIESPLADLSNGFRRVVQTGDASTNRWQLRNLPPGNYFWSVQAIDTAFAGSFFVVESTFTVLPPPIANPDAFTIPTNTLVTFNAAKLLLNDVDPSGLALRLLAVSASSTMGGTVVRYGVAGKILVEYMPPTDFSGNDTFTYTITDDQSAPATGTVTITVGNGGLISLNIVAGPMVDGGDFAVRFAGIPGLTYTIEAASELAGPWTKATNRTAPTYDQGFGVGVFEFREPIGTDSTRFYRTVYPSY